MKLNSKLETKEMLFQRYVYEYIDTNMYILVEREQHKALVIDPNISEKALMYLKEQGVREILILLTHEHYDHTNGVNYFYEQFESRLCCQEWAAKSIGIEKNNRPLLEALHLKMAGEQEKLNKMRVEYKPYRCKADVIFDKELEMAWCGHTIKLIYTPGHSKGSCCIEVDGQYVFTGDSLIPDVKVITRFPGGDEELYVQKTLPYLYSISEDVWIMPGHRTPVKKCNLEYKEEIFCMIKK